MRTISATLVLVLVSAMVSVAGGDEADGSVENLPTFRGLRFGVDVQTQIPKCQSKKGDRRDNSLFDDHAARQTCWIRDEWSYRIVFVDTLSDMLSLIATPRQLDGKLGALDFRIQSEKFAELDSLFEAKYGKPAFSEEQEWQSTTGVRVKGQRRVWKWRGLTITLRAPTDDIDHGSGSVATQEYLDALEKARLEQQQKYLHDL